MVTLEMIAIFCDGLNTSGTKLPPMMIITGTDIIKKILENLTHPRKLNTTNKTHINDPVM